MQAFISAFYLITTFGTTVNYVPIYDDQSDQTGSAGL
jgi:hypothetical protein